MRKTNADMTAALDASTHLLRRHFFVLAVAVLVVVLAAGSMLAFTTRTLPADNVLTFGSVKMRISQSALDSTGREVPMALHSQDWMENGPVSRIVRFENVGASSMFVRARLDLSGLTATGEAVSVEDAVRYDLGTADWTYRDGWYYCVRAVEPGQATPPLMRSFEVQGDALGLVGQSGRYVLTIDAQAVQSAHNAESALAASGWSEGVAS